jgi:hypothetical protein
LGKLAVTDFCSLWLVLADAAHETKATREKATMIARCLSATRASKHKRTRVAKAYPALLTKIDGYIIIIAKGL